jgi:hypothetical protein
LLTLFPLFATGGKFTAGVVDTGGNLPPLLTTPAVPVVNLPPISLILVVHLDLRISKRIFEKLPSCYFHEKT